MNRLPIILVPFLAAALLCDGSAEPERLVVDEFSVGYGSAKSFARRGGYIPVSFAISNRGTERFAGSARIELPIVEDGRPWYRTVHRLSVQLEAKSSKKFECYVNALPTEPGDNHVRGKLVLRLELSTSPATVLEDEIELLRSSEIQVLEVTGRGAPFWLGREFNLSDSQKAEYVPLDDNHVPRIETLSLGHKQNWRECAATSEQLPSSWVGYTSIDCVIWGDGDVSLMTPDRSRALREFVETGGHLILFTGKNIQAIQSPGLRPFLPLQAIRLRSVEDVVLCEGVLKKNVSKYPVPSTKMVSMFEKVWESGPQLYEMSLGRGKVTMLPFGLRDSLGRRMLTHLPLWKKLLFRSNLRTASNSSLEMAEAAERHFRAQQRLAIPSKNTIRWFLGMYVLVLVPINFLVFRMIERTSFAWYSCPAIALVFTVVSYQYDELSSTEVQLQILNVVNTIGGATSAECLTYVSVFSPTTREYEIGVEDLDFGFSHMVLKEGIQPVSERQSRLLYSVEPAELNIRGAREGTIEEMLVYARSRRSISGAGALPVNEAFLAALEAAVPAGEEEVLMSEFLSDGSRMVYEGAFLPILVDGRRMKPALEKTLFLAGPRSEKGRGRAAKDEQ